jgi:chemotaxis protein methyltransferase CheR
MATTAEVDYGYLRHVVMCHSRNVLDASRNHLFDSRLVQLLRNQGMARLEELVYHLRTQKDPALERAVAEAMTINETSFFRDQRPFELLRTELLPGLIERRRSARALRFWSAACSTGQEAVSIAILLREYFPQVAHWKLSIDGTDISADVVERARTGRYHRIEVNRGLPARHLVKYFENEGEEDWVVRCDIRAMCNFQQGNLCKPPLPWTQRFDVILLRNVMLYFSRDTRKALLESLHRIIAMDGFLLLGSGEQASDSPLWAPVLAGGTSYYRPVGKNRE